MDENIQVFYSLSYRDPQQSMQIGIIEHNSTANREYIYMLSPKPGLDEIVSQDYLTNLYHFAWLLNALNDHHLNPSKFGIAEPLDWLCQHPGQTSDTILAIDDHFRVQHLKTPPHATLSNLYEKRVSNSKRHLLSNFDVR